MWQDTTIMTMYTSQGIFAIHVQQLLLLYTSVESDHSYLSLHGIGSSQTILLDVRVHRASFFWFVRPQGVHSPRLPGRRHCLTHQEPCPHCRDAYGVVVLKGRA